ncbi:MAG: OB-fold nucleic acid binding domain-containing protein [Bacteroidales bacterium]|nr:OB-fold nucleic acid binding domain-containing protein [Bacteroidales bacterium]
MKKFVMLCTIAIMMASCVSKSEKKSGNPKADAPQQPKEIAAMLENAENLVDNDVLIQGWVSHVCRHSGRRCFLKSEDGSVSIRVEATGNIESFNAELTGEKLEVKGVMKVEKLSPEYLDDWQAKVEAESSEEEDVEEDGEHCSAELDNIKEMRTWMKDHDKDYYPIYYVDGTDYKVVNEQ